MSDKVSSRSIFISYRRSDAEAEAGRLSDVLSQHFADHAVFMDVDAIMPGRDFRRAIQENLQSCVVLLTIIGPTWLTTCGADGGRRLDEQNDYVRLEIAEALRRDISVIPVLVRGARMPPADRLPSDLENLAYRNAVELTHSRWRSDVSLLLRALERFITRVQDTNARPPAVADNAVAAQVGPAQSNPVQRGTDGQSIPQEQLDRLGERLAHDIGPIASLVVRRAASRCSSLSELQSVVAREIEDPAARGRFLTSR